MTVGRWEVSRVSVDAPADVRVLLYTSVLTLASGVVMGWLASHVGRRRPLMEVLQRRCADAGRATGRALRAVVAAQMAGSIPLAILAVSFATAFLEAEWRDVGYTSEGVVLVQFLLPRPDASEGRESSAVDPVAVAQRILGRYKERYPDESVAATDAPPFRHTGVGVVSRSGGQDSPPLRASTAAVSADYFAVLRVRVLQGRTLQDGDASATSPGVVVSASLARTLWPAADPVGQVLSFASVRRGQQPTWMQVVGVVADVRLPDAAEGGTLMVYRPLGLMPWAAPSFVLARGRGPQADVLSRLIETVIGSHQRVLVGAATTLNARLAPLSYVGRVSTTLLCALAALAVGLTTLGVSGLAVFWIVQRRGQAAIRLALGARPGDIGWLAAREGLTAALAGAGIGLLLTYPAVILATRWAVVAPQVRLVAIVAVPVMLGLGVLVACYPAARLARRLDPLEILRMQ